MMPNIGHNESMFIHESHLGMSIIHYEEQLYGRRRDSDAEITIDDLGRR